MSVQINLPTTDQRSAVTEWPEDDTTLVTHLKRVTQNTRGYDVYEGREAIGQWWASFTVNYELGDVAIAAHRKGFVHRLDWHVLDIIEAARRLPETSRAEGKEFREVATADLHREMDERLAQRAQAASA